MPIHKEDCECEACQILKPRAIDFWTLCLNCAAHKKLCCSKTGRPQSQNDCPLWGRLPQQQIDSSKLDVIELQFPGSQRRINALLEMLEGRIKDRFSSKNYPETIAKVKHDLRILQELGLKKKKMKL